MPHDDRNPSPDNSFRTLFTHPRMIRDLVSGFVREPWVGRLDFATLEPCPGVRPHPAPSEVGAGVVWRLRFQGGRPWLHLPSAFPPEVAPPPPPPLASGIATLLLDLARRGALPRSGRLPGVAPLVLYYGAPLWTVPRQLADLFEPVPHGV